MEGEKMNVEETGRQAEATIKEAVTETIASADRKTKRAGEALKSAPDSLREQLPEGGKAGEEADAVSRGAKQTSLSLQQQSLSGIVEDLEILIRRYPLQTLLLGLGCGYLLSRVRAD